MTTRKTIAPENVLKALVEMELQGVMELGKREKAGDGMEGEMPLAGRLERELAAFENSVRGKRKGYRERVKKREDDGKGAGGGSPSGGNNGDDIDGADGEEPEAKRARVATEDEEGNDSHAHVNGNGENAIVNGKLVANGDETEDELDEEDDADGPVADEDEPEDQEDDAEEDEDEDEAEIRSRECDDALGLDRDPDDYGPNAQLRREALDRDEDGDEMSD